MALAFFLACAPTARAVEEVEMPRIAHILCPVDLSDCSRAAIARALELQKATGARLTIFSVLTPPPDDVATSVGPETLTPFRCLTPDPDLLEREVRSIAGVSRSEPAIAVLTSKAPDAGPEIAALADHLSADIIVVGRNGRSALGLFFLGSVAEDVISRARVPVLVVPSRTTTEEPAATLEILCAVDFSERSKAALAQAIGLAAILGQRLSVLHVVPPVVVGDADMVLPASALEVHEAGEREAARQLATLVASQAPPGLAVAELVRTGVAPVEIAATAAERHAWLIVVGTHGRTAVQRLLFGTTTNRVIRDARCAVMTVPGPVRVTAAA
jgi:nucleotide-binding universal stress UspA family protein